MAGRERNHIIDLARIAAVLMVVLFHSLLFRIELVSGGPVATAWEPGPQWWPFSWLVMILPLFFVAAGYVDAVAVDAMPAGGLAHFLVTRTRRLVGPLVLFVTAVSVVATIAAWQDGTAAPTPYPDSAGRSWLATATLMSRDYCFFLWFVAVYLLLVLLAPVMVAVNDRKGLLVMVGLGLLAAAFDQWSFAADDPSARQANVVIVWAFCHQVGIAYHRGWLRRGPLWVPVAGLTASGAGIALLIGVAGYPPSALAFADASVANNLPPTAALALLGIGQAALLGLLERIPRRRLEARSAARLRTLNALTVDIYLWQNTCIIIAMQVLVWVGLAVPPLAGWLLSPAGITLGSAAVIAVCVPPVARVTSRWTPRLGERQSQPGGVIAVTLLITGTTLVWQSGAVIHPERAWSSLGVLAVWTGAATLAWAAARPATPATVTR